MNNDIQKIADDASPPVDPIEVGGTYLHWKNDREYVVAAIATGNSAPFVGVDLVVYRPADAAIGDRDYARTTADFTAIVVNDAGEVTRRFRRKPDDVDPSVVLAIRDVAGITKSAVNFFCSVACRDRSPLFREGDESVGMMRRDWVEPGTRCGTCGALIHTGDVD